MAHTMHAREIVSGGAVCGIDKQRGVEIFKTSEWARVDCRRCLRHKPPPEDLHREVLELMVYASTNAELYQSKMVAHAVLAAEGFEPIKATRSHADVMAHLSEISRRGAWARKC